MATSRADDIDVSVGNAYADPLRQGFKVVYQPGSQPSVVPDDPDKAAYSTHGSPNTWDWGGYSAVDLNAYITPPPRIGISGPLKLGTLSMLSVTTHRDKFPVSGFSRVAPRGFTYGHRIVAGSLSFNTIQRDAFEQISRVNRSPWFLLAQPDEYPPFDIQIVMVNEAGDMAVSMIRGATLLDSGAVYSLEQVVLSETYSYMAIDLSPLRSVSTRSPWENSGGDLLPKGMDYSNPGLSGVPVGVTVTCDGRRQG